MYVMNTASKLTVLISLFVCVSTAHSKVDVAHDLDFRTRYFNFSNPTSVENAGDDQSLVQTRGLLGFTLRSGESLLAKTRILYSSQFGKTQSPTSSADQALINQFYGWWKTSDTLSIWFGRFAIDIGDGKAFSSNNFEQVPYSFDGARFGFLTDFAEFDLYFVKLSELADANTSGVTSKDPETQLYLLNVEFKDMPEILDKANLHFAQVVRDETQDNTTPLPTNPKQNFQHLSLSLRTSFSFFFWNLHFAQQYGQQKGKDAGGNAFSQNFNGQMFDTSLGVEFPDFYKFKFWLGYHSDSGGEDDAAKDQGVETFQSLFYNIHDNAGRSDIFKWGNLTYLSLGVSMTFYDAAEFGIEALMFSKTSAAGSVNTTDFYNLAQGTLLANNGTVLGSELDLWYEQAFDNGLIADFRLSAFQPGEVLENATTSAEELSIQFKASLRFNLK